MSWKYVQRDTETGAYRTTDESAGSTFAGLSDVNFSNLQDGQVPKYNASTQKWENADESGGGTYPFSVVNGKVCITYQQEV